MGMTENVRLLAWRLLDRFGDHIAAILLLLGCDERDEWYDRLLDVDGQTGCTGLHAVAFFGIEKIIAEGLEMNEWDVNAGDLLGRTALSWAADRGHEVVVEMLLEREDIEPNKANGHHRTPLIEAASSGHEGVVNRLWGREGIDPNVVEVSVLSRLEPP